MDLKKYIRSIPDYPKKGILFRDITTLIKDSKAFNYSIDKIIEFSKKLDFNKIDKAIEIIKSNKNFKSFCRSKTDVTNYECLINDFKYHWFNKETIKFFKEKCNCNVFFK